MLVSESRVLGSREVRLRASLAVVNRDDEGERARELRRFVEEHADIVRIGTRLEVASSQQKRRWQSWNARDG